MRVSFDDRELFGRLLESLDLVGEHKSHTVLCNMHSTFRKVPGSERRDSKIALRMTRGPTNTCIPFHCDGAYATSTTQFPLNSPSEIHRRQAMLLCQWDVARSPTQGGIHDTASRQSLARRHERHIWCSKEFVCGRQRQRSWALRCGQGHRCTCDCLPRK